MTVRKVTKKGRRRKPSKPIPQRQGFREVAPEARIENCPVTARTVADCVLLYAQTCLQKLGRVPSLVVKIQGTKVAVRAMNSVLTVVASMQAQLWIFLWA